MNPSSKSLPNPFRGVIPSASFPAEKERYVLYVNHCCDWCQRAVIVRELKGLEGVVEMVEVDARSKEKGWWFSGRNGGPKGDPVTGVQCLRELYERVEEGYGGRVTVPVLWDRMGGTIVNNESSDIMRMFISGFDNILPSHLRESSKGASSLIPLALTPEIDTFNAWMYDTINNGVYKTGFATTQTAYDEHVQKLFDALDQLEYHFASTGYRYLFGGHLTEPDIRLFVTLVRFDVVYYSMFKCNVKMVRADYPSLHGWLRRLYWDESECMMGGVFRRSTWFTEIKRGYAKWTGNGIVPRGPEPCILPL